MTEREEILDVIKERASALIRHDAEAMKALLAPDFVYTNSNGEVLRRDQYIAAYVQSPQVAWHSQTVIPHTITVQGEIGIVTGQVRDKARIGDTDLDAAFQSTQVYRKISARWLYICGHTSSERIAPNQAPDRMPGSNPPSESQRL